MFSLLKLLVFFIFRRAISFKIYIKNSLTAKIPEGFWKYRTLLRTLPSQMDTSTIVLKMNLVP